MNKRQKRLVAESVTVIAVTAVAVVAMINLKDWINRSEAMRAMEQLGKKIIQYRQTHGSVPPQSYVDSQKESVEGHVRLGILHYRAQWINFDATNDEILAYSEKEYSSLVLGHGYVVLRLDGRVEWMGKQEFEELLSQQQSPTEIEMTRQ